MTKAKCCLLVEDDPDDQELFIDAVHSISSQAGCYVVSNGEEALSALQFQPGFDPDYIFTDLNMPRMHGFQFLEILRGLESFRSVPVIVLSSDFSEATKERARQLGASAFYPKAPPGALREILKPYFADTPGNPTIL